MGSEPSDAREFVGISIGQVDRPECKHRQHTGRGHVTPMAPPCMSTRVVSHAASGSDT
jgi:hypothetical protein